MIKLKENRIIWLIIIIVIIFSLTPYIYGVINANSEYYYTGNQITRSGDLYGYLSFINQAKDGHLLFTNLYATESERVFFHPLWLLIGWLSRIFSLNSLLVYQIIKVLLIVVFFRVLVKFLKLIIKDVKIRLITYLLVAFGGGFFTYLIETTTFLILYFSPLFTLSLMLMLIVFYNTFKFYKEEKFKQAIYSGLALGALFLVHFYDVITIIVILSAWLPVFFYEGFKKGINYLKFFIINILFIIPIALYYLYISYFSPSFKLCAATNITPSGSINLYLLSYGILLILLAVGIYLIFKKKYCENKYNLFLLIWLIINFLLLYSPLSFNRRLSLGSSIPIAIFSAIALIYIYGKISKLIIKTCFIVLISFLLIAGNLFIVSFDMYPISKHYLPAYRFRENVNIFLWAKENLSDQDVIFTNVIYWDTFISGISGIKSYTSGWYYGHEEIGNNIKTTTNWFFGNDDDFSKKYEFLKTNNLSYLFYSKAEKILGNFDPKNHPELVPVYQSGESVLYKVIF